MYLFGQDSSYLLIECDRCGKVLKYDKKYFNEINEDRCLTSTLLNCTCGNEVFADTEIKQKPSTVKATKLHSSNELVKCPKCGSTQITAVPRKWSFFAGFLTNKVDRVCLNCKHRF